jgi:hypothetical protein
MREAELAEGTALHVMGAGAKISIFPSSSSSGRESSTASEDQVDKSAKTNMTRRELADFIFSRSKFCVCMCDKKSNFKLQDIERQKYTAPRQHQQEKDIYF